VRRSLSADRTKAMTSQSAFASTGDLTEKKVSFTEVGPDLFAYTAEGDPDTSVIVGDDSCAVFDTSDTGDGSTRSREGTRSNRQADQICDPLALPCRSRPWRVGVSAQGIIASQETHRPIGPDHGIVDSGCFVEGCGAQNGRPRALRLTIAALGTLLTPGIGRRGGCFAFSSGLFRRL